MRYLFIIQGEGRGHLTQALSLKAMLERNGHEVCGVLIGKNKTRELPVFFIQRIGLPVQTFENPNFSPSSTNKRPHLTKTLLETLRKIPVYLQSMHSIRDTVTNTKPDFVLNFYDHLTGIAWWYFKIRTPLLCIGHQYLLNHPDFEFPPGRKILTLPMKISNLLTGIKARKKLALSFYPLPDHSRKRLFVVPPLLREELFEKESVKENFIAGYLLNPGFAEEVKEWHRKNPEEEAHFFWDNPQAPESLEIEPGLTFHRIHDQRFLDRLSRCKAFACTAGFESVCEAMYLDKPALMVPVHLEQECNAHDAIRAGAGITANSFDLEQLIKSIPFYQTKTDYRKWLQSAETVFLKHLT